MKDENLIKEIMKAKSVWKKLGFGHVIFPALQMWPLWKAKGFCQIYFINEPLKTFKVDGFFVIISSDGWIENVHGEFLFL